MSEFKISGDVYVSKSGNNSNDGLTEDTPKLTIAAAASVANNGEDIIIGTGLWEEFEIAGDLNFIGDGIVVVSGQIGLNQRFAAGNGSACSNIIFNNCRPLGANRIGSVLDSILLNADISVGSNTGNHTFRNCKIFNCTVTNNYQAVSNSFIVTLDRCLLFNTTVGINNSLRGGRTILNSCYLDSNSIFSISNLSDSGTILNSCVLNGVINNIDGGDDSAITKINLLQNINPLFLGDPTKFEFNVQINSPFINSGVNGLNIGNVRTGILQNSSAQEWGQNPDSSGNTSFNIANSLELTSGTESNREATIDLGQIRNSPFIRLNGLPDFLNNVPDNNNTLVNPNHLTFEAQWAGEDGIFNGNWKIFRWNERLQLDITNKSNGEASFDWGNLIDLQLRFLKIRTSIRNNYNIA